MNCKKRCFHFFAIFAITTFVLSSCCREGRQLKIAVSKISGDHATNNYVKWLSGINPDAEYINMYAVSRDSVELIFEDCAGLLLTGGVDVYPGNYGKEYDTARCGKFDFYRDSLEFKLIELAMEREVPVIGVCRGQQILNVALGGSLYVDIPTDINTMVLHRCKDWQNCYHNVKVLPDNLLKTITGVDDGRVTTNHHQIIDRLSDELKVLAVSDDGLIESVGWRNTPDKPFLIAVQWHPERMDTTNRLSFPLAKRFLEESIIYKNH